MKSHFFDPEGSAERKGERKVKSYAIILDFKCSRVRKQIKMKSGMRKIQLIRGLRQEKIFIRRSPSLPQNNISIEAKR